MIKIRQGVFETNSSSVHSMIMCSLDQYKDLEQGNLLIDRYKDTIVTIGEAINIYNQYYQTKNKIPIDIPKEEALKILCGDEDSDDDNWRQFCLLKNYNYNIGDGYYYDDFYDTYVTQNGETVVAFGYYGNDY